MDYLKKFYSSDEISIYGLESSDYNPPKRYVFSTKETREICNEPLVVGAKFRNNLTKAITLALKYFPDAKKFKGLNEKSVNVLHFLRGGISFGLIQALNEAYGFNEHKSSFMSSERAKQNGRWYIKEDQYIKLTLEPESSIFIGDIVATGVTTKAGLAKLYEKTSGIDPKLFPDTVKAALFNSISNGSNHLKSNERLPIKNIIFFTFGCEKLEEILIEFYDYFKEAFGEEFEGIYLFYIEGKFSVAEGNTPIKIKVPGTDLLRWPGLLTPEFELSQYENLNYVLEPCIIYDGGSRSFDITKHKKDIIHHWTELKRLAEQGFNLRDALKERWPEKEYSNGFEAFKEEKKKVLVGIGEEILKEIYETYKNRWTHDFAEKAKSSKALLNLCNKRLEQVKNSLG